VAAGIGVEVAMGVLSCWLAGLARNIVYGQFGRTILVATVPIQALFAFGIKGSSLIRELFN
jgi:hypothetical protein